MSSIVRWRPAVVALAVAALAAACTPVAAPAPAPKKSTPTTKATTTTTTALPTLPSSCATSVPAPGVETTYDVVVDDGVGAPEVETVTAEDATELAQKVEVIEDTLGPVTAVSPQVEVGVQTVDPSDDTYYLSPFDAPSAATSVALNQANFDDAWVNSEDGLDVVVAVVDTGVDGTHPGLSSNLLSGTDFVDSGNGQSDPYGHGTHVAGIIAEVDDMAAGIGGAPNAKILPVRVLNAQGSGYSTDVALGIKWAVDNSADVINLSLGGPCSDAIGEQIDYAVAQGITVVAAAGNCGTPRSDGLDGCNQTANNPVYPAAFDTPGLIGVGALTTSASANTKASFSNNNSYVDIAAPGTSILSTYNTGSPPYARLSGTSMATPFVSAVAAMILRDCGADPPTDLQARIENTASQGATGFVGTVKLVDAAAAAAAAC